MRCSSAAAMRSRSRSSTATWIERSSHSIRHLSPSARARIRAERGSTVSSVFDSTTSPSSVAASALTSSSVSPPEASSGADARSSFVGRCECMRSWR